MAVNLPNLGEFADPAKLVDIARVAEESGWDGWFIWDHIVVGDGVPIVDPWIALAAVATVTRRLTIGPMVTPLPRRRPWVVARQASSLQQLAAGRLVLGVGLGAPAEAEFGTFGEETDGRVRADKLDEGLRLLEGIWSGRQFSHQGRHYQVHPTVFAPKPLSPIPIWIAGSWPHRRPIRRSARFHGVFPMKDDHSMVTPDEVVEIKRYVEDLGAGPGFTISVATTYPTASLVADYEEAGVTWLQVMPHPAHPSTLAFSEQVRQGPPRQ